MDPLFGGLFNDGGLGAGDGFGFETKESKKPQGGSSAPTEEKRKLPAGLAINESMEKFVANSKFSDVTFVVGDTKFPAHRVLLALRSPVFEAMMYKFFPEQRDAKSSEIVVKEAKAEHFRSLLLAIYTDKPPITPDNVADVLALAKRYQVESVVSACISYMTGGYTAENVCAWFARSAENSAEAKSALAYIEDNTKAVIDSAGFLNLKADEIVRIVRSNKLTVEEIDLFTGVLTWASSECKRLKLSDEAKSKAELLKDIIPHIRFPIMDMEHLAVSVSGAGVLPQDHLVALFTYVGQRGDSDQQPAPPKLPYAARPRQPRKPVSFFKWDAKSSTSGQINLTSDGLSAGIADMNGYWHTIFGDVSWKPRTGVYEWDVVLEQYDTSNTWNICLGVVPADFKMPDWNTSSGTPIAYNGQAGWAMYTGIGHVMTQAAGVNVPARRRRGNAACQQGDVITVRVDTDKGQVEWLRRGKPFPEAGQNIARGITGAVKPAVSMIMTQRVKLRFDRAPVR